MKKASTGRAAKPAPRAKILAPKKPHLVRAGGSQVRKDASSTPED